MSKILVIESDNKFFFDQLKIEGITAESGTVFDSDLHKDFKTIVFNNVCLSDKQCGDFAKFFEKNTNLVFLNPCSHVIAFFNLRIGSKKKQTITKIWSKKIQVFKSKELFASFPFHSVLSDSLGEDIAIGFERFGSNVLLFGFNYNFSCFHLNQGKDVTRDIDGDGVLRVDDGITIDKSLKLIPQIDLLRQFIVSSIEEQLGFPLPRTWFYPNKKKLGIVFSHDSDNATMEDFNELMRIDSSNYIKATIFAREMEIPSIDFEKAKKQGMDIQLHTVYAYAPNVFSFLKPLTSFISSLFFFKFFQKKFLRKQKQALEKFTEINGNRNHGLIWNKLSDHPFWLHEEGFEFDSTYGANYDNGFSQATGFPYFLRDPKTLKKSNVLEFSSQIMEAAFFRGEFKQKEKQMNKNYARLNNNFGRNLLNKEFMKEFESSFKGYIDFCNDFINDSAEKFHSIITFNFHYSQVFPEHEKKGFILEWYKKMILKAKSTDSLIESMSFFNDFWRKRLKVNLNILEWNAKTKTLRYLIENNNVNLLSQILPINFKKKRLKQILVEGKKTDFEKLEWNNNEFALFNVVNKKELEVKAVYA